MSAEQDRQNPQAGANEVEESPENLPVRGWVTLVGFAVFVVLFGTCAFTFMFN